MLSMFTVHDLVCGIIRIMRTCEQSCLTMPEKQNGDHVFDYPAREGSRHAIKVTGQRFKQTSKFAKLGGAVDYGAAPHVEIRWCSQWFPKKKTISCL